MICGTVFHESITSSAYHRHRWITSMLSWIQRQVGRVGFGCELVRTSPITSKLTAVVAMTNEYFKSSLLSKIAVLNMRNENLSTFLSINSAVNIATVAVSHMSAFTSIP